VQLGDGQLVQPAEIPGLSPAQNIPDLGDVVDTNVTLSPLNTAPERFPALDGSTLDDDSNRQFPILTPSASSENDTVGFLGIEKGLIETGGSILSNTTDPYENANGSLNGAGTILTNPVNWPAPIPKLHDMVRITSGVNGGTGYHTITAVTANTVIVDPAYTTDSGFSFHITVSNSLETGAAGTLGGGGTTLTDGTKNFLTAGVLAGHTVVVESGGSTGERRQVQSLTATVLTVSPAFTTGAGAVSYRVDDSLPTFGDALASLLNGDLFPALDGELDVLNVNTRPVLPPFDPPNSEQVALEAFLAETTTSIFSSTTGDVVATTLLTDTNATFQTDGVSSVHFVIVLFGANAGAYQVDSATSETTLLVQAAKPFPASETGMSYSIVTVQTGVTQPTLDAVIAALVNVALAIADVTAFQAIVTTSVAMAHSDTSAFASGILPSDFNSRDAEITTRFTEITTDTNALSAAMTSGDRLYDVRYVWINARINKETGVLVQEELAVGLREAARLELIESLTKLLTTA